MIRSRYGLVAVLQGAWATATLVGGLAAFSPACSSSNSAADAGTGCSTQCAAGNMCIDDGSGDGPQCHKVCTQQDECPFGWYCNDGSASGAQPANWCVQSTTTLTPTSGQWGTPCLPTGGESNNMACDSADGFACYGQTPTDANAFCTVFGCAQDSDCPGGWWCETVNTKPNVTTVSRSFGQTRSVCTPRQYCATCVLDHDCPALLNGTQQHCIQDSAGNGFCTPQCATSSDCNADAKCVQQETVCTPAEGPDGGTGPSCQSDEDCPPVNGFNSHCYSGACTQECGSASDCPGPNPQKCTALSTCIPYAGVCLGDGSFCSPCRSDGDCTSGGYCMYGEAGYSTDLTSGVERFCSAAAMGTCPTSTMSGVEFNTPTAGMCPSAPAGSAAAVASKGFVDCSFEAVKNLCPANQCVAFVTYFTGSTDGTPNASPGPGCWTPNGSM